MTIIGFSAGLIVSNRYFPTQTQNGFTSGHQVRQGGYSLINPLLECEIGNSSLSKQLTTFKYSVERKITQLQGDQDVQEISVYFRDLNTGEGFTINPADDFSPASLLKLPILIAYYKQAEKQPGILNEQLQFNGIDRNTGETIKPTESLEQGKQYFISDLLSRMIVNSDNNAMALLVENLPVSTQNQVFKDLGITIPGVRGSEDFMSVGEYAAFFRLLYNASYLSKDYSQKALELLSKVDFNQGLRAGVPANIRVANKFGERFNGLNQQLHDCGIVYYKNHPYLLCIMSRGSDFKKLALSLKSISQVVYTEVDRQVRSK